MSGCKRLDIPVVLFIFRRSDTVLRIIEVLRMVKPKKVYLLSDEGRNEEERSQVRSARLAVEIAIDWDCCVIKRYANENLGVLNNIGRGARWVFEREEKAIFLEDDNLPAISFFRYCDYLLEKYENDARVLWVCGTNYLPPEGKGSYEADYFFSQHMLPCGWASWANKFLKFYDVNLDLISVHDARKEFLNSYRNKALASEQMHQIDQTRLYIEKRAARASWDYQMLFSLRVHHMYGVVPVLNQVRNIGVDQVSEHGGTSISHPMTQRFCELPTYELSFPLKDPMYFAVPFESDLDKILLPPLRFRIKRILGSFVKLLLGMDQRDSLAAYLRGRHE